VSKADTLGPAPAFSAVRSARRNAISKIGAQGTAEAVTELPVTVISENPDNPRNHLRNLDETVESVREVGIILPIVVATVEAYLHDRPERADDLDDGAQYVVVDGHRRLEASRRVGLAVIPVRVDNARVSTDETLLEAAFVANYHRDDMTDLEEAHALKSLVDYYGSQSKASKRLGIPQGTISTKLSLLKLAPDLQADLVTGKRTVEHVRNLGKLAPEEQRAKADERAQTASARNAGRTAPPKPEPQPVRQPAPVNSAGQGQADVSQTSEPADYHGVIIPTATPADPPPKQEPGRDDRGPSNRLPEARTSPASQGTAPRVLPYDNGFTVAQHLILKMPPQALEEAIRILNRHAAENGLNIQPESAS